MGRVKFSGQAVHIGNAHGRIALWLNKDEAEAIASLLHHEDQGSIELYEAIEIAYPVQPDHND